MRAGSIALWLGGGILRPSASAFAAAIVGGITKIVSRNGIDTSVQTEVNGTKQWLSIRGRDRRNPILLFIHGGPGGAEWPLSWTYRSGWEDYFTVVQWGQRGAGKTYLASFDYSRELKFSCPIVLFEGRRDPAAPSSVATFQNPGRKWRRGIAFVLRYHLGDSVLGKRWRKRPKR